MRTVATDTGTGDNKTIKHLTYSNRHAQELRESAEREQNEKERDHKPVVPPGAEIRQIKITSKQQQQQQRTDVEEKRTITTGK